MRKFLILLFTLAWVANAAVDDRCQLTPVMMETGTFYTIYENGPKSTYKQTPPAETRIVDETVAQDKKGKPTPCYRARYGNFTTLYAKDGSWIRFTNGDEVTPVSKAQEIARWEKVPYINTYVLPDGSTVENVRKLEIVRDDGTTEVFVINSFGEYLVKASYASKGKYTESDLISRSYVTRRPPTPRK